MNTFRRQNQNKSMKKKTKKKKLINCSDIHIEKIPRCIGGLIHTVFAQQFEKIPHCLRQRSLNGFRTVVDTCKMQSTNQ